MSTQKAKTFVERVAGSNAERFAERPKLLKLNVGDFFEHGVPVVENAWRVDNGTRITEQSEDIADPEFDLLGLDYPIRHDARAWFATFISPEIGSAGRVRQFVSRLGFKAYWPRSVRIVRRGKAKTEVTIVTQVFPRYVLVHLPAKWVKVGHSKGGDPIAAPTASPFGLLTGHEARFNGLAGLVKFGGEPIWLHDILVERIVRRERAGAFNHTVQHGKKRLAKLPVWCVEGALVRIAEGPFASWPGLIEDLDQEKGRAKVAVNIFGRETSVDLDIADLAALC